MGDVQEQLNALRRRIALIDRKYAGAQPAVSAMPAREVFRPARYVVEQWLSGEEVATAAGGCAPLTSY